MVVVDVKHLATTAFDHPEAPKLRYRINDMSQSFFCLFVCFWHLKKKIIHRQKRSLLPIDCLVVQVIFPSSKTQNQSQRNLPRYPSLCMYSSENAQNELRSNLAPLADAILGAPSYQINFHKANSTLYKQSCAHTLSGNSVRVCLAQHAAVPNPVRLSPVFAWKSIRMNQLTSQCCGGACLFSWGGGAISLLFLLG